MSLFIIFILGAVLLGAGAMLSPAWRTAQPRVALGAVLCLALVVGGAVFYAEAIDWDTLAVDYLLFALLAGVVLGGTLSTAQARAEAKGERLRDSEQGWPGPQDLAFLAVAALIILLPILNLPTALGTQAQLTGFHSLSARLGASFNSLMPLHPTAPVIVAPGFHALSAYLSQQLDQSIPLIQWSVAAVLFFLLVWLAYDFGAELQNKRLGRALAIATLLCGGLHRSYLDGHFTELMALLFMQAFLLYALRFLRQFNWADMIAGGLMMGAVAYTSLTISIAMLLGFAALCALVWMNPRGSPRKSRWGITIGFPLVALLGTAPWLLNSRHLIFPPSPSPFPAEPAHLAAITLGQGLLITALAAGGGWIEWRQRRAPDKTRMVTLLMLIWLLLILEFSLVGLLGRLFAPLDAWVNAPSLARHGVILPLSWLGGKALLHLWEARLSNPLKARLRAAAHPLLALAALLVLLAGFAFQPLLTALRPLLDLPAATVSRDEIAAMIWIRDNTAQDALILSAAGNGWLPLYAERRAHHFRAAAYFEWDLVPPAVNAPPADYLLQSAGAANGGDGLDLRLVFEQGAAQVYQVID